jgi:hypothetical protein
MPGIEPLRGRAFPQLFFFRHAESLENRTSLKQARRKKNFIFDALSD